MNSYNSFLTSAHPTILRAVMATMRSLRTRHPAVATTKDAVQVKADASIQLTTDVVVEDDAMKILRSIDGAVLDGEEGGAQGSGAYTIFADMLDGSFPFALGAHSSTTIINVCDSDGMVIACYVGHPWSGQIWHATIDTATAMAFVTDQDISSFAPVRVWDKPLINRQSRALVDTCPGFTRKGEDGEQRVILGRTGLNHLHAQLCKDSGFFNLGSNGYHHALVASGGRGAIGAITTAIGKAPDVAGVLLVEQAGGSARAFRVEGDERLASVHPRLVTAYDILITAPSIECADYLSGVVQAAYAKDREPVYYA